jgi:hypothetical protein
MPNVYLFGGEKGGVGKSMVCKAAIQYHLDQNLDFICFDTDRSNPDIYRIYGKILDCQLGIFSEGERYEDTANAIFNAATSRRVLVNLPAQVFIPIKTWFEQNDLLEIAPEAGVTFHLWHITDGGFDSLTLLRKTLEYFKDGVRYVVVKNYGKCDDWEAFEQDKALQKLIKKYDGIILNFPKFIGSIVRNRMDAESLSFKQALERSDFDIIQKQRIRKLLKESYAAFEETGVFATPSAVQEDV